MVQLILILLLLAGFAKCATIARKPTTNRKCVASLMALLAAWLVSIGASWLFFLIPDAEAGLMFVALLPVALIIGSALLALSGLKECARSKGYYTQGQFQAVTALLFSGLLLLLLGVVTLGDLNLFSRSRSIGGQALVFEEFNFKFLHPGKGWTNLPANRLDTNAVVALQCARPELQLLIVPGPTPGTNFTANDLAAVAMRNLSNTLQDVEITYRGSALTEGMEGVRVHSEAMVLGKKQYFQHRLLVAGDVGYQFIVAGPDKRAVAEEANSIALRFSLLKPVRPLETLLNLQ